MKRTLYFTDSRSVEVREERLSPLGPEEVRVESRYSAISAGTEGLIYRGEAPETMPADETIDALAGDLTFPLRYGYAVVGQVVEIGERVADEWLDRQVFAYNPHESTFVADPSSLVPIPETISPRVATLLANAETAVTFVLDGTPTIGERVAVFGQGTVGLLTTALLARYPLETVVTVDYHERRRRFSERLGADRSFHPEVDDVGSALRSAGGRADLTFELSGNPDALEDAIEVTGYDGRIVVGSWYGTKAVSLELGGRFHRDRLSIESSQVSTIDPERLGRWTRTRRHEAAWEMVSTIEASDLITHEVPFTRAHEAYELLEQRPNEAVQVVLTYDRER